MNSSFGGCESSDVSFADPPIDRRARRFRRSRVLGLERRHRKQRVQRQQRRQRTRRRSVLLVDRRNQLHRYESRRAPNRDHGHRRRRLGRRRRLDGLRASQLPERHHRDDYVGPQSTRHLAAVLPVAVYTGGSWGEYLGTSWSSPASVALIVEANELHGTKLGWVDPDGLQPVFNRIQLRTTRRARQAATVPIRVMRRSTIKPPE